MNATKRTPLVETLDYAASATRSLALERVGIITDLELRMVLQTDTSNTPTIKQDALARMIKGLAIKDGQGHTWWACGDGRQLHWLNYLQYGGQVRMDTPPNSGTDNVDEALWHIHFGFNPRNPFDPTAGIPAAELGQLALEITWGAATDIAAASLSIDSGTVYVTPATILAGTPEYNAARKGMFLPNVRWEKYDIASALGNLGVTRELPAGAILRKTLVMVVDSDDTRMVTDQSTPEQDVTEIGYIKALENTIPFKQNWVALEGDMQARLGLASKPVGVAMVNWGEIVGDVALDLRKRLPGHDYIGFTTVDTGGDIWLLHLAYSQ